MRSSRKRIDPVVGHGTMAAFSLYFNLKIIGCRRADARCRYDHRPSRERHTCHYMNHQCGIDLWILQQPGFDHVLRTFKNLFSGLKHQLDGSLNFILMCFQQASRTQEHCGMHVVAAGMHISILRSKRHIGFFPDRQGVHICPQKEYTPRFLSTNKCSDACLAAFYRLKPNISKFLFHESKGRIQSEPCFCILMQCSSFLYNQLLDTFSFLKQLFRHHIVIKTS